MKRTLFMGLLIAAVAPAVAQVNHTVGATGTYQSLYQAVKFLDTTDGPEPNRITLIDEGPYLETERIIINPARAGNRELIIEAADGLRPVLVLGGRIRTPGNNHDDSGLYISKTGGGVTVRDLIIIPDADPQHIPDAGVQIQPNHESGTSVTLENLLISSNDGNNAPIASLDGLTEPVVDGDTTSFVDEAIFVPSSNFAANPVHNITIRDTVISGVNGADSSDGIRVQGDGGPGSRMTIGPNVTISYNTHFRSTVTSTTIGSSIQPGGHNGFYFEVVGTQEQPVRLINNVGAGIGVTHTYGTGLHRLEWVIIANNTGAGIVYGSRDSVTEMNNVTIANNGMGAISGPPVPDGLDLTLSNVIVAGNGDNADPDNRIALTHYSTDPVLAGGVFTASDSAIVLDGNYTLNTQDFGGDGIDSDENYTVTLTDFITADPDFVSLDPSAPGFAEVANSAYGTAGPGGAPLTGGGTYNTTSVSDWSVY